MVKLKSILFIFLFLYYSSFSLFSDDIFNAVESKNFNKVKSFIENFGTDVNITKRGDSLLYYQFPLYLLHKI